MELEAREIRCPKTDDHIHKKILLVVNDDYLSVYCREHGWIKIELKKGDENINFENVRAKITPIGKVRFNLSPIPGVAIGNFKSKRNRQCQT
jgi:hypothetical protein